MKKWLAPLAILIVLSSAAMAQWQVPNYSVPLGRGTGATGFKRAVPGTTGLPLTSNGAAADPTFRQPISTSNKNMYVSTAGSDSADGLSWATAKLTIQAAIDAISYSGNVYVGSGVYTLSAAIGMRSYITLECSPGTTITQANAANLLTLVDFSGYIAGEAATGSTIKNCWIDGNRANNTGTLVLGHEVRLIYFGNTSDVTIDGNTLVAGPGYGIAGSSQTGLNVRNNNISDTEEHSFFIAYVTGGYQANCQVINNRMTWMLIYGVDGCIVAGNQFDGSLYGNTIDPMRVNISGTAVTWVSGPTFSGVKSGMVFIAKDGTIQKQIATVNSTTSVTLDGSGGTETNVLAMMGTDDLLGVGGASRTIVANNIVKNGASFGISTFGTPTSPLDHNMFIGNIIENVGKNGFTVLGDPSFGASNNQIRGNTVINAHLGGRAGCAAGVGCLHSYLLILGTQSNMIVDGNHAQDDLGNTTSWLNVGGLAAGAVRVGNNNSVGAVNEGIDGAISSITLSAGWGSTAATSLIVSYGNAVKFKVTANGAGIAAFPSITVNTVATKLTQGSFSVWSCKMTSGSGTFTALYDEQQSTPSLIKIGFLGTPGAGSTYEIQCN